MPVPGRAVSTMATGAGRPVLRIHARTLIARMGRVTLPR